MGFMVCLSSIIGLCTFTSKAPEWNATTFSRTLPRSDYRASCLSAMSHYPQHDPAHDHSILLLTMTRPRASSQANLFDFGTLLSPFGLRVSSIRQHWIWVFTFGHDCCRRDMPRPSRMTRLLQMNSHDDDDIIIVPELSSLLT
jgi:hypothetical protein